MKRRTHYCFAALRILVLIMSSLCLYNRTFECLSESHSDIQRAPVSLIGGKKLWIPVRKVMKVQLNLLTNFADPRDARGDENHRA